MPRHPFVYNPSIDPPWLDPGDPPYDPDDDWRDAVAASDPPPEEPDMTAPAAPVKECDIHKHMLGVSGVPAKYDAKSKSGPWGFMCQLCFDEHAVGTPGLFTELQS